MATYNSSYTGSEIDDAVQEVVDKNLRVQRLVDLRSNALPSPYFRFDGIDDYISKTDAADHDVGTDDFSVHVKFRKDNVTDANAFLVNKESGGVGYGLEVREDDLWIRFDDGTTDATAIIGTAVFSAGTEHDVFVTFDRDGNATAYVDGIATGTTVDISSASLTLSNAGDFTIGSESGGTTKPFGGQISLVEMWNKALTAAEVKEFMNGAIPYKYQEASQTAVNAGSFTVGKAYRIATVGTTDFTLIGAADNNVGTEFVATGAGSGTGTATPIGAVAEYDGSSMTDGTWYDKSGNDLDGTVTGPTLENKVSALDVTDELVVGGLADLSGASAGQIKFPATQNASADANTLDDYEEGTWTPTLYGNSTAGTYELDTASGTYFKIGKTVIVHCKIVVNATPTGGGSGSLVIGGLPYNYDGSEPGMVATAVVENITFSGYVMVARLSSSDNSILGLVDCASGSSFSVYQITSITGGETIMFTFTYQAVN